MPPPGAHRPFDAPTPGGPLPPPLLTSRPRRSGVSKWVIGVAIAIVGLFLLGAFTIRQISDPKPLPGEEAAITGVGEWGTFVDPNRAFAIDFPAPPTVGDEVATSSRRSRLIGARVLRVNYLVEYHDFFEGFTGGVYGENYLDGRAADFATDVGGSLKWTQRVAVGGLPASEFVVETDEGVWHVAAVLTGKRLYLLQVFATVDAAEGYRRFAASFKPMTPEN